MTSTPLALLVQAASYVLFPAFARITGDRERFRAGALRSLRMMCALAFPLGMLLVPLGVPAAVLLFGDVWRDAGYAAMALVGVPVAGTLISFASEICKADGRPDIVARLHVVSVAASTVAVVALLPFGLVGVSAGVSVGLAVASVYGMSRTRALLGFDARETLSAFSGPAIASLAMVAVLTPLEFLAVDSTSHGTFADLLLLGGETLLGLLVYAGALAIVARTTAQDVLSLGVRVLRRGA